MNFNNADLSTIKTSVLALLPDARVLLFGSRARGDYNQQSDFDVLVITKMNIPMNEKITFRGELNKVLVTLLKAPVDVLLNSEDEINQKKNLPGHIIKWAMKEAVEL